MSDAAQEERQHPLLQFADAVMSGDGHFECGETWSLESGWRGYLRTGQKMIMMPARALRKLGEQYRNHPEAPKEIREIGGEMIACAKSVKARNARHEIPDGVVAYLPFKGRIQ